MSLSSSVYISFPGNAAEVFSYYHEIFGGTLDLMKYEDHQMDLPFTPPPGAVAHATLTAPGLIIAGGDGMGDALPSLSSEVYSFLLSFDTVEEAEELIERFLSTGGEIGMPFEVAPWGDHYGQVKDKFGVLWAFNVEAASRA